MNMVTYVDLLENLSFLDNWEERYRYILDLGKALSPLTDSQKTSDYLVKGCVSQVWLVPHFEGNKLHFTGDSDSHLVKGLLAIVLIIVSDKTRTEIGSIDFQKYFTEIGLTDHLTPQRSNGLFSVVSRIISLSKQE